MKRGKYDPVELPEQPRQEETTEQETVLPAEDSPAEAAADAVESTTEICERQQRLAQRKAAKTVLGYVHDVVYLLAVVLVLFLVIFRIVVVSGPSMYHTLLDGDYLLLLSSTIYHNPQPGDIVVACKDTFEDGMPIVKRVIATEGQEVDIDFDAGIVYVDGVALEEPYTNTLTNIQEGVTFPVVVEEGCVFLMGDNRNSSRDSRYPAIGMVDTREILGKAIFLFLPGDHRGEEERDFSRIGVLP